MCEVELIFCKFIVEGLLSIWMCHASVECAVQHRMLKLTQFIRKFRLNFAL